MYILQKTVTSGNGWAVGDEIVWGKVRKKVIGVECVFHGTDGVMFFIFKGSASGLSRGVEITGYETDEFLCLLHDPRCVLRILYQVVDGTYAARSPDPS